MAARDGGAEGSMAWLRATVARFAHGEAHARRRAYVEAELARIDADGLRQLAGAVASTAGDDRIRVLHALARAMDLPELNDPPVRIMRRTALAATRAGGTEIAAGETVLLEVGPLGLAFGHGPRACPGRTLALALAEGALEPVAAPVAAMEEPEETA